MIKKICVYMCLLLFGASMTSNLYTKQVVLKAQEVTAYDEGEDLPEEEQEVTEPPVIEPEEEITPPVVVVPDEVATVEDVQNSVDYEDTYQETLPQTGEHSKEILIVGVLLCLLYPLSFVLLKMRKKHVKQ